MQSYSREKTHQWNSYLLPTYPGVADIPKCRTKAGGKGRVAQPAKDNSSHYKKYQELFGVKCEILKVLHHGKARTDQRPIYNAIGHIIELIAQDHKEQ